MELRLRYEKENNHVELTCKPPNNEQLPFLHGTQLLHAVDLQRPSPRQPRLRPQTMHQSRGKEMRRLTASASYQVGQAVEPLTQLYWESYDVGARDANGNTPDGTTGPVRVFWHGWNVKTPRLPSPWAKLANFFEAPRLHRHWAEVERQCQSGARTRAQLSGRCLLGGDQLEWDCAGGTMPTNKFAGPTQP
jgi:hypothetical protein